VGRLFVGSVAERLVRLCKRPVLVVPPGAELKLLGPPRTGPLRLTVVLDRGPAGEAAAALAGQLRTSAPADVTFVHLYDSDQEHARLGLPIPFASTGPDPDIVTLLDRDLRPRTEHVPGQGRVELRLCAVRGSAAEFLGWTAVAQHADLLIVGAASGQGDGLERSAAVDVVRAATGPVLVAPAPARAAVATGHGIAPLRSVLVATDLSDAGNAAVAESYRLLRASGGVVELCHVSAGEPLSPERWTEAQKQLWALVPAQAEAHGIVTRVSVLHGDTPAEALLQASERLGADVLVVGSHGRSGLARAVLGSVADSLVRRSAKPVLIVRGRGASA
jgi:nucleotide-binding universal stress UspA family protein